MSEIQIYLLVVLFESMTYYLIGSLINKNNAGFLLAGYNTMTSEQKKEFDLDNYLKFFTQFFKILSLYPTLSFFLLYLIFTYNDTMILMWVILQLIPFIFFVLKSLKFKSHK